MYVCVYMYVHIMYMSCACLCVCTYHVHVMCMFVCICTYHVHVHVHVCACVCFLCVLCLLCTCIHICMRPLSVLYNSSVYIVLYMHVYDTQMQPTSCLGLHFDVCRKCSPPWEYLSIWHNFCAVRVVFNVYMYVLNHWSCHPRSSAGEVPSCPPCHLQTSRGSSTRPQISPLSTRRHVCCDSHHCCNAGPTAVVCDSWCIEATPSREGWWSGGWEGEGRRGEERGEGWEKGECRASTTSLCLLSKLIRFYAWYSSLYLCMFMYMYIHVSCEVFLFPYIYTVYRHTCLNIHIHVH